MLNYLPEFIASNSDLLYDKDTVPFLYYENDVHYVKGWFGKVKRDCSAIGYLEQPWDIPLDYTVKQVLKDSPVKLKRGDLFVWRKTPTGSEIIPGHGIVASNVYGRLWNEFEVQLILSQPNIKGIIWHNDEKGDIYASADTSGEEMQAVWHRSDSDGRPFPV